MSPAFPPRLARRPPEPSLGAIARTLETASDARTRWQAHGEAARKLLRTGQFDAAAWHWTQALHWGRQQGEAAAAIEALCGQGLTAVRLAQHLRTEGDEAAVRAAWNRARDACFATLQALRELHDDRREVEVLHHVAMLLETCGDHDDAEAIRERARRTCQNAMGRPALPAAAPRSAPR